MLEWPLNTCLLNHAWHRDRVLYRGAIEDRELKTNNKTETGNTELT